MNFLSFLSQQSLVPFGQFLGGIPGNSFQVFSEHRARDLLTSISIDYPEESIEKIQKKVQKVTDFLHHPSVQKLQFLSSAYFCYSALAFPSLATVHYIFPIFSAAAAPISSLTQKVIDIGEKYIPTLSQKKRELREKTAKAAHIFFTSSSASFLLLGLITPGFAGLTALATAFYLNPQKEILKEKILSYIPKVRTTDKPIVERKYLLITDLFPLVNLAQLAALTGTAVSMAFIWIGILNGGVLGAACVLTSTLSAVLCNDALKLIKKVNHFIDHPLTDIISTLNLGRYTALTPEAYRRYINTDLARFVQDTHLFKYLAKPLVDGLITDETFDDLVEDIKINVRSIIAPMATFDDLEEEGPQNEKLKLPLSFSWEEKIGDGNKIIETIAKPEKAPPRPKPVLFSWNEEIGDGIRTKIIAKQPVLLHNEADDDLSARGIIKEASYQAGPQGEDPSSAHK
jgi:hypothetical protein